MRNRFKQKPESFNLLLVGFCGQYIQKLMKLDNRNRSYDLFIFSPVQIIVESSMMCRGRISFFFSLDFCNPRGYVLYGYDQII
ncbi:MAG: hypothetical protein C0403_00020 [Desulfobacterium sp.]|nr:hypothetical protein [Desulfobacterium sp.]